jgi:hypothetical protein
MAWLWIAGAALAALCSVACGLTVGQRAASGQAFVWQPTVFGWAFGLHGTLGVLALYMLMQARGLR